MATYGGAAPPTSQNSVGHTNSLSRFCGFLARAWDDAPMPTSKQRSPTKAAARTLGSVSAPIDPRSPAASRAVVDAAVHEALPDVMTLEEVAEYLRISRNTANAMLLRGEVRGAIRAGRQWRVSRRAFLRAVHGDDLTDGAA